MPVFVAAITASTARAGVSFPYRVLHEYCKAQDCADGRFPAGTPIEDASGNVFTTTYDGARFGYGALVEIEPRHDGTRYYKHVMKEFCDDETADCGSGGHPQAGVIQDVNGDVYGTTATSQDKPECGTIYRQETVARASRGRFRPRIEVLHTFGFSDGCNPGFGSLDYAGKETGQLYDGTSPLFGMTEYGGSQNAGTVYELIPPKPGRNKWTETVLVNFCSSFAPKGRAQGCQQGAFPAGNLVMDSTGNLFGETTSGVVFALSPNGSGGFDYSVLYTSDTSEQYAALALRSDGSLIGVAYGGGTTGNGTLFRLAPACRACAVRDGSYQYTLLHAFCPTTPSGTCSDGADPNAVVVDQAGNIYGVTYDGGPNPAPPSSPATGGGVAFEYSAGGDFFTVHDFCAEANCADGGAPYGGLMLDGSAHLVGTAAGGGSTANVKYGAGVLYELSLP